MMLMIFSVKVFIKILKPVKFKVNKTKVDELASTSVRYHKRKFQEVLNSVTENYLNQVAPSQKKEFLEILIGSYNSKNGNH